MKKIKSNSFVEWISTYGWTFLIIVTVMAFLIVTYPTSKQIPKEKYEIACEKLSDYFSEYSNCTLKGEKDYTCFCCFVIPDVEYKYCMKYSIQIVEEGEIYGR